MKLLNNDKPKQVEVHRDYDPYDQPTTPDYNYEGEPTLSQVDDSNTQKMTVTTNEHFEWVNALYTRQPPKRADFTTNQLLARIADLLSQQRQVDVPSDFTHPRSKTFQVGDRGEWVLDGITQYGYLYIPPVPVEVDVWLGYGSGQYLTTLPVGTPLNAQIPHVDVITLTFASPDTVPITLFAYPSTRPFVLRGTNPSDGIVTPEFVSGRAYDSSTAYGGNFTSTAIAANRLHLAFFSVEHPFTSSDIGIDVTGAGALGTVARLGLYTMTDGGNVGTLIADAGTVPVDAVGVPTVPLVHTFQPGILYGLPLVSDGAPTIRHVLTMRNIAGTSIATNANAIGAFFQAMIFGPLPATVVPPWSQIISPRIFVVAS